MINGGVASIRFSEVNLLLHGCIGAQLAFAIQSSEVFALGGDLLYILYGSCSGAFSKFAGERLFARWRVRLERFHCILNQS